MAEADRRGPTKAYPQSLPVQGRTAGEELSPWNMVGHPLHAILTDMPIGAWTPAIAVDALDSMSARRQHSVAADTGVALGLAGQSARRLG